LSIVLAVAILWGKHALAERHCKCDYARQLLCVEFHQSKYIIYELIPVSRCLLTLRCILHGDVTSPYAYSWV